MIDKLSPEELFNNNRKFVHYVINKRFTGFINVYHLEYFDLESEGNLGLWKACLTFKQELGIPFASYAYSCIYNEILMFLESKACTFKISRNKSTDKQLLAIERVKAANARVSSINDKDIEFDIEDENNDIDTFIEDDTFIKNLRIALDIHKKRYSYRLHIIIEDFIWNIVYGDCKLGRVELGEKYKLSQPYITRIIRRFKKIYLDVRKRNI